MTQLSEPAVHSTNGNGGNPENVKWDELGFSLTPTDYMYVMNCPKGDSFLQGSLVPFGDFQINPSSGVLNYGQGLFEGLKAYRRIDGSIQLFRPKENALRMKMGAERLCMPSPTVDQFIESVKQTVLANKRWVPPPGKGSLYLRPLLLGSGCMLGVGPATSYKFIVYASPVGNYHKGVVNLIVEENVCRAAPGGTGGIKAINNYSSIFKAIAEAKSKGFSDVLFLDAVNGKYIEEASTSNIFLVKGNTISTPATRGTILPGITRKSIIELVHTLGYQAEEREISVDELSDAEEVFCTGTAVVISSVNSITYQGKRKEFKTGTDTVARQLYDMLTGIQTGLVVDKMGWTMKLC